MSLLCRLRGRYRHRSRGQSIVEFALVAPVVLLILMVGLDFGRVYLGWVNLNNTARIAANYAAANATAMAGTGTVHDNAVAKYRELVANDAGTINCTLPDPIPDPTFPGGTDIGELAHVGITCEFGIITPIISNILGSPVLVSASADFPIRTGIIDTPPGGGPGSVNAAFNVSPASGTAPFTVTFSDFSTGSPTTYAWDLNGDGLTDSNQIGGTLTYDFSIPGTYFASLTVSNGLDSDTATQVITVNSPPGPVVVFTVTPMSGNAPLTVSFNNTSTGANPLTYLWSFGDGTTSTAKNPPNKTYSVSNTYTVTLQVTDGNGLSNSASQTVTVAPAIAMCTVPDFAQQDSGNNIQQQWTAAGFQTTVIFNPSRPPEYKIKKQDLKKNTQEPCATAVQTVFK